jgi:hypothetical protein
LERKEKGQARSEEEGISISFLWNNSNTYQSSHPVHSRSKMVKSLGKRERQPIKCWGCEGNHLYRDFPQKIDTMSDMQNIPQATTVEDVGRNIPRIYVSLENHT